MPRYEVGVGTQLAFRNSARVAFGTPPGTVGIAFEGRTFVWHHNEPGPEGEIFGPTVTVVAPTEREYQDELPEAMERFLSVVAFEYDRPVESESLGGSGESDPFHRSIVRVPRRGWGFEVHEAPAAFFVEPDASLRRALALYREGLNAASPFYGFLSFWNVLDAVFDGDGARRNSFLRAQGAAYRHTWPGGQSWPDDVALHLRDSSRNAVAHVIRPEGSVVIDPDLPDDRARLYGESRFLRDVARAAVTDRWPSGISWRRREQQ